MNNFQTDNLLDLAKEKNQEEVDSQLFLKATQRPTNGKYWLAAFGTWMVAKGEKLQARYTTSLRANQLEFPLNKAKKARAH
ncbi:MAG: hypothetical protein HZB18_18920 [Chloroflexi bacterium]|nr:hypothetical protein [Chloroflexota bacterium]